MNFPARAGQIIETDLRPEELASAVVALDDGRFLFKRKWFWETLGWFGEQYYLRCERCGDEMQARDLVEEEINHALAGCNGSLREFFPPRP